MADTNTNNKSNEVAHISQPDAVGTAQHNEDKVHRIETTQDNDGVFEKGPHTEKMDEFGSHAKTDPLEIALVKRLDWYMLVSDSRVSGAAFGSFIARDDGWALTTARSPFSGSCTSSTISTGMPW